MTVLLFTLSSPPALAGLIFIAVVVLQIIFSKTTLFNDENRRRLQHMSTGQALLCVSYVLPKQYCLILLALGCTLIVYTRFLHDAWYRQHFYTLLRPYELQYGVLPGAFYFLWGTLVVACAFPMDVARYSVACLSYADPAAAWIGSTVHPNWNIHSGASACGCAACFVTAFAVGRILLPATNPRISVIGAVVCTIAEALPVVNDNLVIPISTATAVQWAMSFE